MVQKQSWIFITDNTNIKWVRAFHLYKGFFRKKTTVGFFIKGSARVVEPPKIFYKGFKKRFNLKGDICRNLLIRSLYPYIRIDGMTYKSKKNAGFIIKKIQDPKSPHLYGPIFKKTKRKRILALFPKIL